jgi:hypothetical protein
MRPCRIQLSGVTTALLLVLLSGASSLLPARVYAQATVSSCTAGTVQKVTFSSTVNNLAPNTTNNFSLPQYDFSGSGYQLISAVLNTKVTTTNTITFTNTDPSNGEQDFNPTIRRTDVLKLVSPATTLGSNFVDYNMPFTELDNTGDNITYGPQTFFNNTSVVTDSVTTAQPVLNSFVGTGSLNFSYKNTNFLNSVPTPGVTPSGITETDNITFSVTYYFCNPTILSINVLTFTATKENDQTVSLNWVTGNEQAGRRYDIEVSADGSHFTVAGSTPSDPVNREATYQYSYPIPAGATGHLYFRLLQVETDGKASYSPVRVIDLSGGGPQRFSIYPNPPTDFIQLSFPVTSGDWQVDILAADGARVQRNYYANTNQAHVNFGRKLPPGTYFARATDARTAQSYVGSFVIQ